MSDRDRCTGLTRSGERCKLSALPNSAFCHLHDKRVGTLRRFLQRDNDLFWGFVLGVITETAISDGYDILKNALSSKISSGRDTDLYKLIEEMYDHRPLKFWIGYIHSPEHDAGRPKQFQNLLYQLSMELTHRHANPSNVSVHYEESYSSNTKIEFVYDAYIFMLDNYTYDDDLIGRFLRRMWTDGSDKYQLHNSMFLNLFLPPVFCIYNKDDFISTYPPYYVRELPISFSKYSNYVTHSKLERLYMPIKVETLRTCLLRSLAFGEKYSED